MLASWLRQFQGSCVVHVGAGLSTSAGIPDFRGRRGVWTKLLRAKQASASKTITSSEQASVAATPAVVKSELDRPIKPEQAEEAKPFDETVPTVGHLILRQLCLDSYVKHIISQNVDGLFLKANLPREFISELHGNFYLDECTRCRSRFIRSSASETMRLQRSTRRCPRTGSSKFSTAAGSPCKGYLRDTILDWESPIPHNQLQVATRESKRNKLHICIGTSLQLRPSKDLVCNPVRNRSYKLVIINLQPVQVAQQADLVINYYADEVMKQLADELSLCVPAYLPEEDPTKREDLIGKPWRVGR